VNDPLTDPLLDAVGNGLDVIDLGRQYRVGMPQSPNHPHFWHTLPRRHGDMSRPDGASAANDMITMGTHVGTHIDALAHVSLDGRLHGGADAQEAGRGGRFDEHGVHTIEPMVCRGVLLDVAAHHGVDGLEGGYEITVADLEATRAAAGVDKRRTKRRTMEDRCPNRYPHRHPTGCCPAPSPPPSPPRSAARSPSSSTTRPAPASRSPSPASSPG